MGKVYEVRSLDDWNALKEGKQKAAAIANTDTWPLWQELSQELLSPTTCAESGGLILDGLGFIVIGLLYMFMGPVMLAVVGAIATTRFVRRRWRRLKLRKK